MNVRNSRCWVSIEQMMIIQLVKKFPVLLWIPNTYHRVQEETYISSLSWASLIHFTFHTSCLISILLFSSVVRLDLSKKGFTTNITMTWEMKDRHNLTNLLPLN
jgi:hypothetical protein